MGRYVIVAYRPRPGREAALRDLVREHVPTLRGEGLASGRPALVLRAQDGTLVEVFEWSSKQAIEAAHRNPTVQRMWERFGETCEYVKLRDLAESAELFAEFEPLEA